MGGGERRYAELVEIYEELEQADGGPPAARLPGDRVSDLSIEETAHRIIRLVDQRRGRPRHPDRSSERSRAARRWGTWFVALAMGITLFYVVLTPIWLGLRIAGWLADKRARAA